MTAPMPTPLPYGIRDIKLTPYIDRAVGTVLASTAGSMIDLPNMQTFSFSEAEEYNDLRGDDRLVTTHGNGAQVEWELEAGGMSLQAWELMGGGEIITTGLTPNRAVTLRKLSSAVRPFFRTEGQAISDSGGDVHTFVYRCKCNDSIEGEFADGEFFTTSVSGLGFPLLAEEGFDLLYDFVHNETAVPILVSGTPTPNPTKPEEEG